MAAVIYSETFVWASDQPNVWTGWTVPAGKRAVIRSATLVNGLGTAATCYVHVAGKPALYRQLPAVVATESVDMRLVVYRLQRMEVRSNVSGISMILSGYLFTDPSGAIGPPSDPGDLSKPTTPPGLEVVPH